MKKQLSAAGILLTLGIVFSVGVMAQQTPAAKASSPSTTHKADSKTSTALVLDTQKAKASYAIGINIAQSLQRDKIEVDTTILLQGLNDALGGKKLLMTDEEAKAAITAIQTEARARHEAEVKAVGEKNKKQGDEFLAANKTKEGVLTLPSGLQYKVLKQGDGPKPVATDTVVCNYRGTFIDGTEFDSSYKRNEPATFPVGRVIKGWTEILQLMPVGSKYQVVVPAELAYGDHASPQIGPNATLLFDIELLSIKEKPAAAAAPATTTAPATATADKTAK
jgi:FKBP-type peptidyl-prolyl cis-trans isomerase